MTRKYLFLLVILFISGCQSISQLSERRSIEETATQVVPPCYYVFASEDLPELSKTFENELRKTFHTSVTGYVQAFGENCIDSITNNVVSFSSMQTDFYVTIKVKDLNNEAELASFVELALDVIDKFPSDQTPGPLEGYAGITFQSKNQNLNLWFSLDDARTLRGQGTRDIDLYQALLSR